MTSYACRNETFHIRRLRSKKVKYKVRARCNLELHIPNTQYRTAKQSLVRMEFKLEPEIAHLVATT